MAGREAAKENAAITGKEGEKRHGPLFAIFPDFLLNFPGMKQNTKAEHVEATARTGEEESKPRKTPDVARFPDARPIVPPPLKLEAEESAEGNSRNMWQVYAFGAFLIGRWIWARWKERRAKDESSREPSPSPDDDN